MLLVWPNVKSVRRVGSKLREVGRAAYFILLVLVVGVPLAIGIFLFSLLYTLAILGPWLSGKVSVKGRFRRAIDIVFGVDEIHEFRDDLKSVLGNHLNPGNDQRQPSAIRKNILEIQKDASEQAERGEFVLAIVTGVLSLVVGTLTGTSVIGWLLGSYSLIMSLTIGLHVVVLDILAYNKRDEIQTHRRNDLVLMEAWNKAILTDRQTQAEILLVGIMYRISSPGYDIATDLLEVVIKEELTWWQAIVFISASLGELSWEFISPRR